jgi:hypothetical protein
MKQYVIDELQPDENQKLTEYLKGHFFVSGLERIFWVFLADDLLNGTQLAHSECGPFYIAIELTDTAVKCELLVRAKNRLRCDCIGYANRRQRDWVMGQIDLMMADLAIQA